MSEDKLLPCPFCGQEPSFDELVEGTVVSCSDYDCIGSQISTAAECWNTSAPTEAQGDDESVRLPTSVNEAKLMTLLGMSYLESHAPEQLKNQTDIAEVVDVLKYYANGGGQTCVSRCSLTSKNCDYPKCHERYLPSYDREPAVKALSLLEKNKAGW